MHKCKCKCKNEVGMAIKSTALVKIVFTTSSSNPVEREVLWWEGQIRTHFDILSGVTVAVFLSLIIHAACSFFDALFKEARLKGVSPGPQADGWKRICGLRSDAYKVSTAKKKAFICEFFLHFENFLVLTVRRFYFRFSHLLKTTWVLLACAELCGWLLTGKKAHSHYSG